MTLTQTHPRLILYETSGGEFQMASNLSAYLGTAEQLALKLLLSFARAFVAALVVGLAGVAAVPDLSAAKALVVAAVVAAITAGLRAVQAGIGQISANKGS